MKTKNLIYLSLILIFFNFTFYINNASAKDYKGYGEYRFGPNIAESTACKLAFERAKTNALSNAFDEKLFSMSLMRCSEDGKAECELNQTIISSIGGTIKKIKKKTELPIERLEGKSICRVQLIANIAKPKKKPDPNFNYNLRLNKKLFRDGERLTIEMDPTMKMFVNIFQWQPYRSKEINLNKIFPNKYEAMNMIEDKKIIPDEKYSSKKYFFTIKYPDLQEKKYVDEYIIVIATKNDVSFLEEYDFESFQNTLSEIPNDEKRIKKASYEILKN